MLDFRKLISLTAAASFFLMSGCAPNESDVNQCIYKRSIDIINNEVSRATNNTSKNYGGPYDIKIIEKNINTVNMFEKVVFFTIAIQSQKYKDLQGIVKLDWKIGIKSSLKFNCYDHVDIFAAGFIGSPLWEKINRFEEISGQREAVNNFKKELDSTSKDFESFLDKTLEEINEKFPPPKNFEN